MVIIHNFAAEFGFCPGFAVFVFCKRRSAFSVIDQIIQRLAASGKSLSNRLSEKISFRFTSFSNYSIIKKGIIQKQPQKICMERL